MTKTITLRLQENKYQRFKQLAECDNRSISDFIEKAASRFIKEEEYLDDFENDEILSNKEPMGSIQRGCEESVEGNGKLIETQDHLKLLRFN
jgi:predicted CopG family antitoxin